MKTTLKVIFEDTSLKEFTIENPGHIPSQGEIFYCKWDDFIKDKDQIKRLEEIEEDECWMVERFRSNYSKEETECLIILHLSYNFPDNLCLKN